MFSIRPLLVGAFLLPLIHLPYHLAAQCNAPAAPWLLVPQTSSSLTLNWATVNGATQYQLRYWELSAPGEKCILEDLITAPYVLEGLRKSTTYSVQIRSICGNSVSDWSPVTNYLTANTSQACGTPTGVSVIPSPGSLTASWTSSGSHTLRYRAGYTGDWLIPSGAMSITTSSFVISGLSAGTYQVEIKHNCGANSSYFNRYTRIIDAGCPSPTAPLVTPDVTSASVLLPASNNVTAYTLQYRPGIMGNWITAGIDIPPSLAYLNPPLAPATMYQVRIQATCSVGTSSFSAPTTFTTLAVAASCLANKDYGKNLSAAQITALNNSLNTPSPYTLGSMIGVNDGGLIFRSFQNSAANQMAQLTPNLRNFHTMDEDFDNSLTNYAENIKPKETIPEGTPAFMARNKALYDLYHNRHGFSNIIGAMELLQYSPQSWKDKMYKESDWSVQGPAGIKTSFENYTKKFIDEFSPPGGALFQQLVSSFQVGNELWDYPIKSDYHNMLAGARAAFISKYGEKSAGGWKMDLVAGAFQAFRNNTCSETLRDVSNCGGDLARHDFIGDYLDVPDCNILKDLGAIDCHPYSFMPGTTNWTYPENPVSEDWQIRNLAAWLLANKNEATGILAKTRLWSTEYGFDSNPNTGVGEKTQSAYLLRGLLLHSRYHYEKVYFYNAFDHARTTDTYYDGLYNSSGFWRLGTHPDNSAWASPLVEHNATPKPSWFGMLDLKARFGEHVFYKALVEDPDAFVFLLAKPDGTDPYLVFWSPAQTNDANINQDIPINKVVNWVGLLPGDYAIESNVAQTFAESLAPGQTFSAAAGALPGTTTLNMIRRNPSFIRLVVPPTGSCPTVTSFKRIPHAISGCSGTDNFYEVKLANVGLDDQIALEGLPQNGINIPQSSLNGIPFTTASFQANLRFISNSSLGWLVSANNGMTQTLKLSYCWAKNYHDLFETTAMTTCSGLVTTCTEGNNSNDPGLEDRNSMEDALNAREGFSFAVYPNPGAGQIALTYFGAPAVQGHLRIVSTTGQLMLSQRYSDLGNQQQWQLDAGDLPKGVYFICLQTNQALQYLTWEKL